MRSLDLPAHLTSVSKRRRSERCGLRQVEGHLKVEGGSVTSRCRRRTFALPADRPEPRLTPGARPSLRDRRSSTRDHDSGPKAVHHGPFHRLDGGVPDELPILAASRSDPGVCHDQKMRDLVTLFVQVVATLTRLPGPGGAGSGTGAVARRSVPGRVRGLPLRARIGRSVAPSPDPAASHAACGFPGCAGYTALPCSTDFSMGRGRLLRLPGMPLSPCCP